MAGNGLIIREAALEAFDAVRHHSDQILSGRHRQHEVARRAVPAWAAQLTCSPLGTGVWGRGKEL
jgi:hypothetical protein